MADESNSAVPSTPTGEDKENQIQVDPVGESVLKLLHEATGLAAGTSRYALNITQKLSDRLGSAESRVAALEEQVANLQAEVEFYREKSKRAEEWLNKISGQIQEQVNKTNN
jgi:endonuclease III